MMKSIVPLQAGWGEVKKPPHAYQLKLPCPSYLTPCPPLRSGEGELLGVFFDAGEKILSFMSCFLRALPLSILERGLGGEVNKDIL